MGLPPRGVEQDVEVEGPPPAEEGKPEDDTPPPDPETPEGNGGLEPPPDEPPPETGGEEGNPPGFMQAWRGLTAAAGKGLAARYHQIDKLGESIEEIWRPKHK